MMLTMKITMMRMTTKITAVRFRSMEDLGGKQEKTAGWELVRLLRFPHHRHGCEDNDHDHHHNKDHDHDEKGEDEYDDEVVCPMFC